jgi:hypothetical protein
MLGNDTRVWNYVLAGSVRAGTSAVASSVNNYGGAICHVGLFDKDVEVRKRAFEDYFGESSDGTPEYYVEGETNPWQFINSRVLDNPQRGETAVGVSLAYDTLHRFDLYDLLHERGRAGDFSVVHVVRNPVACFISLKQAEHSGQWVRTWNGAEAPFMPSPLRIIPEELVAFCSAHETVCAKVRAACEDRLEVQYRDLCENFQGVMAEVFEFLELPPKPVLAKPAYRRLKNRPMLDRVTNWAEVRLDVSTYIKRLIESDDFV